MAITPNSHRANPRNLNDKLSQLAHYICDQSTRNRKPQWMGDVPGIGSIKLNKALWLADFIAYMETGASITGAIYVKRNYGPAPKDMVLKLNHLKRQRKVEQNRDLVQGNYTQTSSIALEKADASFMTDVQKYIADKAIDFVHSVPARHLSNLTHNNVWKVAELGADMPFYAFLVGQHRKPTDEHVEWADKYPNGRA